MSREKIMTISIKDCDVQTFRAGGPGGQNQNKRDTAVRVTHRPSGAVGISREHRTQLENKRAAFVRMANSNEFRHWVRLTHSGVLDRVSKMMNPSNLVVETYTP